MKTKIWVVGSFLVLVCVGSMTAWGQTQGAHPRVNCLQGMMSETNNHQLATQLCKTAKNKGPFDCYKEVRRQNSNTVSPEMAVKLCRYADTSHPAQCVREAIATQHLAPEAAIDLCHSHRVEGHFIPKSD